jgi:translocation and assembly module TamB
VVQLQESVALEVAQGRVNQRGLSIPLGRDARVELDGSVGFDQTLALRARLAAEPGRDGGRFDVEGLDEMFRVLKLGVPIGGTLNRPAIDRRALRIGLRDAGNAILKGKSGRDAVKLLEKLVRPEGENAPRRR